MKHAFYSAVLAGLLLAATEQFHYSNVSQEESHEYSRRSQKNEA